MMCGFVIDGELKVAETKEKRVAIYTNDDKALDMKAKIKKLGIVTTRNKCKDVQNEQKL